MRSTGKLAMALVAAVGVSVFLSGCFSFQSVTWSPAVVKAGKTTDAVIKFVPDIGPTKNKMIPFVLVGVPDVGVLSVTNTRTFDVKGKFGGPEHMISDANLRNVALEADECELAGQTLNQIDGVDWTAVRTEGVVNDRDKFKTPAVSKVRLKVLSSLDRTQAQVYVFGGNWSDQGNFPGVPEEPEVACSGGSISTITIGG